jgi:hypothetical protein
MANDDATVDPLADTQRPADLERGWTRSAPTLSPSELDLALQLILAEDLEALS